MQTYNSFAYVKYFIISYIFFYIYISIAHFKNKRMPLPARKKVHVALPFRFALSFGNWLAHWYVIRSSTPGWSSKYGRFHSKALEPQPPFLCALLLQSNVPMDCMTGGTNIRSTYKTSSANWFTVLCYVLYTQTQSESAPSASVQPHFSSNSAPLLHSPPSCVSLLCSPQHDVMCIC